MKTVLVTGGLSGIGLSLVRHYLRCGHRIFICDQVRETHIDPSLTTLLEDDNVRYHQCDIAIFEQVNLAVTTLVGAWGAPDLVINCAGILKAGPFTQLTETDFVASFSVNVLGSRHIAAACLPHMQAGSQLVLVASMAGTVGIYGYSAYGASKFAVLGMAQCLRAEYAPKRISISVICPPEIETPMLAEEARHIHPATRVLKDFAGRLTLEKAVPKMVKGIARNVYFSGRNIASFH